jgi:uncharacterized membrane protein AbrB (regulator of aidB expression)
MMVLVLLIGRRWNVVTWLWMRLPSVLHCIVLMFIGLKVGDGSNRRQMIVLLRRRLGVGKAVN